MRQDRLQLLGVQAVQRPGGDDDTAAARQAVDRWMIINEDHHPR